MAILTIEVDVEPHVEEQLNDWIHQIKHEILEYNKKNKTKIKYYESQILGDIFNDLFKYGIDCTVSWDGTGVSVDY